MNLTFFDKGWDGRYTSAAEEIMKLARLSERERKALEMYVLALADALPGKVERVLLFGSKARRSNGTRISTRSSDTDLAIVVQKRSPHLRKVVAGLTFGPVSQYKIDISPLLIPSSAFREGTPLARRIRSEGITLWTPKRNLFTAA